MTNVYLLSVFVCDCNLKGQSLGYAFVNFANQEDADKAIFNLNGMHLQNKTIKVCVCRDVVMRL